MIQEGAVFKEGIQYIRIIESGCVYPVHAEREKMVTKDLAEYVTFNGEDFDVVKTEKEEVVKKPISTPARKPAAPVAKPVIHPVVAKAPGPPAVDLIINEE